MRKRLCGLALTLLLALTVCPPPALAAESPPSPEFRLNYQWNGDQTQLAVTVSLANNPGIAGYDITLTIDGQLTGINPVVSFNGSWSDAKYGNANWMTRSESGDTLRVLCVTAKDVTDESAALCTVTFENVDSNVSALVFSVSGTVATASMELLTPADGQCETHLNDDFRIDTQEGYAVITTYGSGYHGKLRLIVSARQQNGKFLGCRMMEVDLVQDSVQELTDFELTFPIGESSDGEYDGELPMYTLLVLDEHFVPLFAPISCD